MEKFVIFLSCVFKCLCYSSIPTAHRKKLYNRAASGIFLDFKP